MQAIILGAGEGSRMGTHTSKLPKPFLSVGGRPLLEYQLHALTPVCDDVLIALGYGFENTDVLPTVEDYVSVPGSLTLETIVVDGWDEYENAWTCHRALDSPSVGMEENVLLLCGDIAIEPDLLADFATSFEHSLDQSSSYVLAVDGIQDEQTAVRWDKNRRITEYGAIEGHREAGVFLLNKSHIETAKQMLEHRRDDWFPVVFEEVTSKPYLIDDDRHVEINTPGDLERSTGSSPFG